MINIFQLYMLYLDILIPAEHDSLQICPYALDSAAESMKRPWHVTMKRFVFLETKTSLFLHTCII